MRRTSLAGRAGALLITMAMVATACTTAATPTPTQAPTAAPTAAGTAGPSAGPSVNAGKIGLVKDLAPLTPTVTIKGRTGSSLTTAPFWYAIELGYFEQLGLKFEVVTIAGSGDVVAPLAANQMDLAGTAFGSGLYNAITRDLKIVAVADNGKLDKGLAGSAAVVKKGTKGSYGTDWCALKGKKIAIQGKTTGLWVTLQKALATCQLKIADVTVVELGFAETNAAITNGAVDVAFQVEPFVASGVAAGLLDIWRPLDEGRQGQQMNMILLSPQFSQNHDAALRFLVAYIAATRVYLKDAAAGGDKTRLGNFLSKYLSEKDPTKYANMIMMGISPDGALNLESISESLAVYQSDGNIPAGNLTLGWIKDDLRKEALTYLPDYK
jgi:ABC-type nitrate/sulfonate/bicarbonate transport system substrate-binding protein